MQKNAPKLLKQTSAQSSSSASRTVTDTTKQQRPPTYIGISAQKDPAYNAKLATLLETAFKQSGEDSSTIDAIKSVAKTLKPCGGWKAPASHHVSTLFIGGDKSKMNGANFKAFT